MASENLPIIISLPQSQFKLMQEVLKFAIDCDEISYLKYPEREKDIDVLIKIFRLETEVS